MNEMDHLTRFRDAVPPGVSPRAEQLFRAGLREDHYPERSVVPHPRNRVTRIRSRWRLGVAVFAAAALVAGIVVAVLPSRPAVLTVKLLADRASAAALNQPTVNPGQWVYRVVESSRPRALKGRPRINTEAGWETADGEVTYGDNYSVGLGPGNNTPSYSQLGSLPTNPAALDAYLAHRVYPDSHPTRIQQAQAAFSLIRSMLSEYVLPPTLEAELYQALAIIPGIKADNHVTAIDGQAGVAFVMPVTPQSLKQEIILNASNYSFLAQGSWWDNSLSETAVVRMVVVGAPGSTQPSLTPPTAAELLAEQAAEEANWSVTFADVLPGYVLPSTWILRKLATSSGDQTVWATADDSEQASYVNGRLQVCSRSAPCAKSTQWLMPAGPSYTLVQSPSTLSETPSQLLTALNAYHTGCADVAGDCNAVNAMANIMAGYGNPDGPQGGWFLMLADIPKVTVQKVTDVTGQADVAFRFPSTDGVTEILLGASTHQFVGYVRDGVETVITKEVPVSEPGSLTRMVYHPKPGRRPTWSH
jgi:hypothetical protein